MAERPPQRRADRPGVDRVGVVDDIDVGLLVGDLLASFQEWPESLELNLQGVHAVNRLDLDRVRLERIIEDSATEIAALRQALGQ